MNVGNIVRRLTGVAKNAVAWGVAWFTLAFATILGLRTVGVVVPAEIGVVDAIGMGIRVGVVGGIAGGAFALFISRFYRGRRLSGISWMRFGLSGAVVAGLFMVAFFGLGGVISGDGFPALRDILSDLIIAPLFGGIAAGASMWLAQRGETLSIKRPDEHDRLHAGSAPWAEDLRREPVRARPRDRAESRIHPT